MHKIKNGFGEITEFNYKRLSEGGSFYNRGVNIDYPINIIQTGICVVSQSKSSNGLGSFSEIQYQYEALKIHKAGKGFMGFTKVITNNITSGFKTIQENEFSSVYFSPALKKLSTLKISDNSLITETNYSNTFSDTFAGLKCFWLKITDINENNVFEKKFINTNLRYDIYGNIDRKMVNINNVEDVTTFYVIEATVPNIIPFKIMSMSTVSTRLTNPAYTVTTDYLYNTQDKIREEKKFSGLPKQVTTTYKYHPQLGNLTFSSIAASGLTTRTDSSVFDPKGRFPIESYNTLNQKSVQTFESFYGNVLTQKGLDGLTITYEYDTWGKLKKTIVPENYSIIDTYGWDINSSEGTVYYHLITHPGKPDVKIWYDQLGRERKKQIEGHLNEWITTKTTYDIKGNVSTTTAPYKTNEAILTTTTQYDPFNRIFSSSNALGTTGISYTYNPSGELTTTTTAADGKISSTQTDAAGKLIKATDNGGTLSYTYNSQGNVTQISNATQNLIFNGYDDYGRQNRLEDANAGTTLYEYDAFGQLKTQTNPLNQIYSINYDALGRVTTSTKPEGTTTNIYFPPNSGSSTNKLKETSFANIKNEYTYDPLARLSTKTTTIEGVPHLFTNNYNAYNLTSRSYPGTFSLNYTYDANGYLTEIRDQSNTIKLFETISMNGLGQYKSYKLGNNKTSINTYYFGIPTNYSTTGVQNLTMTWNYQNGNLSGRTNHMISKTETFQYDDLNRLRFCFLNGGIPNGSVSYLANGNIDQKSDAGSYQYHNTKFNAVDYITSPLNIPNTLQSVTYTSYAQPNLIVEGPDRVEYTYGADEQRIKAVTKQNNVVSNTRYYFGDYEKDITGSVTKHIYYISAGDGLIAIGLRENNLNTFNYIYTDHLGSIVTLTNKDALITDQQSFDAWGRRRNPANWTYASIPAVQTWLKRGYTGHEHLNQFGLINMNGRMYDPVIGRMLSTDNFVQSPDFTQSYNRYSYAMNNPLNRIDPSGEIAPLIFVAAIAIGGGMNLWSNIDNVTDWKSGLAYFASGALGGGISVVNPAAGGLITANMNIGIDIATGNLPSLNTPREKLEYLGKKGLDGLGAAGAGSLAKLGGNWVTSWVQSSKVVGTNQILGIADKSGKALTNTLATVEFTANQTSFWSNTATGVNASTKLLGTARDNLLGAVENPSLRNMVSDLYRKGAQIGSGSTADMIRKVGDSGHIIKGSNYSKGLQRLIDSGKLSPKDMEYAQYILDDLKNALMQIR